MLFSMQFPPKDTVDKHRWWGVHCSLHTARKWAWFSVLFGCFKGQLFPRTDLPCCPMKISCLGSLTLNHWLFYWAGLTLGSCSVRRISKGVQTIEILWTCQKIPTSTPAKVSLCTRHSFNTSGSQPWSWWTTCPVHFLNTFFSATHTSDKWTN